MMQYINLTSNAPRDKNEENVFGNLKKEIESYSSEFLLNIQVQAGINFEETLNPTTVIILHNTRKESVCIEAIRTDNGTVVEKPKEVTETIRYLCLNMYKPIQIDDGLLRAFLNYECDISSIPVNLGDEIK